uniref:Putative plant transposon protein domain-containing protein n=1 Tax=Solanum tuberosum TaxID=4113 RepID=M1DVE4_SOLTU
MAYFNTESYMDSPLSPFKRHRGISINEPFEAQNHRQTSTPQPSTQDKNKFILCHDKAVLVGTIIDREHIYVGAIVAIEILMRARKEKTLLPFPVLITQVCERARYHFRATTYIRVTPASSSDIRRIEAECLRDDMARRKPPPPYSTPSVNLATSTRGTSTPAPSVEKKCIHTLSSAASISGSPHYI